MFDVFTPDVLRALWRGTQITLSLTLLASVFGLALGFVGALGRTSRVWPLRALAGVYIEIFRGTPLLVQLFSSSSPCRRSSRNCASRPSTLPSWD